MSCMQRDYSVFDTKVLTVFREVGYIQMLISFLANGELSDMAIVGIRPTTIFIFDSALHLF